MHQSITSEENILAHVPMHQATTGLNIRPDFKLSQIKYSSTPPTLNQHNNNDSHT